MTGKSVRRINGASYGAGENTIVIQRVTLTTGIYLLKMNAGNQSGLMKISVN